MEANSTGVKDFYRAAVGESKADFYLRRFLSFDEPGSRKLSWNWPAFFVSFPWMLYRRMYGLALLYLVVLPIVLAIIGAISMLTFGEGTGTGLYILLALIMYWLIVPMFANALYHGHVRKRIQKVVASSPSEDAALQRLIGQSSVAGGGMIAVIVLVCFIPVLGILAAISIPAYQDYTIRAQVTEGLNLSAPVKASIAASYGDSNTVPADIGEAGFDAASLSGKYVESIEVEEGAVLIRYGNTANRLLAGGTLSLTPQLADGELVWACGYAAGEYSATDINPKFLPSTCRQ